ncbi:MAG: DotU family type IV/VI secretion system protein [Planctomycetota bacterium]
MSATETPSTRRTLEDLTRDWFLFFTTFRRNLDSLRADPAWVREKLLGMLRDMEVEAERDVKLEYLFKEARYPLVYFGDDVLLDVTPSSESDWGSELLEENVFRTRKGGEDFFERMQSVQDRDVLLVYFKCLCLGFKGKFAGKELLLREQKEKLFQRLHLKESGSSRFCPDAYSHTDDRDFRKLPAVQVARIAVLTAGYVVLALVVAIFLFNNSLSSLDDEALKVMSSPIENPK